MSFFSYFNIFFLGFSMSQTHSAIVPTGLVINKTTQTNKNGLSGLPVENIESIKILDAPQLTRAKKVKRSVITTARVIQESLTSSGQRFKVAMVTLTYAKDDQWKPNHIRDYIDRVRKWGKRGGGTQVKKGRRKKTDIRKPFHIRYIYVAELTKRGRVHYHVIFWLPRGYTMPMADKQGWWKHGTSRTEWARKPVGYIAKYASKGVNFFDPSQVFPKGCRIQGSGGLDLPMKDWKNWILCPVWLKELLGDEQFSVRKKASYWCVEKTYCYSSPWFFDFINRELKWRGLQPIREYLDVFPDYSFTDYKFISDPVTFEPAQPKYLINAISARLNVQDAVANIKITGYYDAIDAAILQCTLKS